MGANKDVEFRLFPKHGTFSKIIIISGILFLLFLILAFVTAFIQSLLGLL